jgi:hypothetical protein
MRVIESEHIKSMKNFEIQKKESENHINKTFEMLYKEIKESKDLVSNLSFLKDVVKFMMDNQKKLMEQLSEKKCRSCDY